MTMSKGRKSDQSSKNHRDDLVPPESESESDSKKDSKGKDPELLDLEDDGPPPPMIQRAFSMMMSMGGGRPFHPIFDKFETEHVDRFLEHSHLEQLERISIRKSNRWFSLTILVIVILSLGWLIAFLLPENRGLLEDFFKLGVAFVGGVGSGYGLKVYQEQRRD